MRAAELGHRHHGDPAHAVVRGRRRRRGGRRPRSAELVGAAGRSSRPRRVRVPAAEVDAGHLQPEVRLDELRHLLQARCRSPCPDSGRRSAGWYWPGFGRRQPVDRAEGLQRLDVEEGARRVERGQGGLEAGDLGPRTPEVEVGDRLRAPSPAPARAETPGRGRRSRRRGTARCCAVSTRREVAADPAGEQPTLARACRAPCQSMASKWEWLSTGEPGGVHHRQGAVVPDLLEGRRATGGGRRSRRGRGRGRRRRPAPGSPIVGRFS